MNTAISASQAVFTPTDGLQDRNLTLYSKSAGEIMKKYPKDIEEWIHNHFSDDLRVHEIIKTVNVKENERIIRCILILSDCDYDSVSSWAKKAIIDYRDLIYYAEYDNRSVRKFNFNYPINKQKEYTYAE